MQNEPSLKRCINFPLLTFYGLGTIIGAGIYVLLGKVAGLAGYSAPLAFLIASVVACFTAFTYAELSSRMPRSAGEAVYISQAFHWKWLTILTGYSIVAIGIVSAATITNGFVGYLEYFVQLPAWLIISALVILLGSVAAWGISESVKLATAITILELGGLLFVLFAAGDVLGDLPDKYHLLLPTGDTFAMEGVFLAAFLAFYAFIGFEDMVNVAEEVEDAPRTMPKAILTAIVVSTVLYVIVAIVAVLAIPPDILGQSEAPMAEIIKRHTGMSPLVISAISLVAIVNGALIQIIMATRVLYGMSRQQISLKIFQRIHPKTRTPLWSTLVVTLVVLLLALWFPLVTLAAITSFVTLIVFALMHLALIRIKALETINGRNRDYPENHVSYPSWIPAAGFIVSVLLIAVQIKSI